MPTVTLERSFDAPIERVFAFVTKTEHLLKWWGHDGMTLPEHDLGFDRPGPWMSVLQSAEGNRFKMSGQVTHVEAPTSVGFTWAWHDAEDRRGAESHVTIRLAPAADGGTDMVLTHVDLPDEDMAGRQRRGWTSTLGRLERVLLQTDA